MWENLVGRGLPAWRFFYPKLQEMPSPRSSGRSSSTTYYRAINKVRAVAHPRRGGRGDVQPAHHPALRARAGDPLRGAVARGPARGLECTHGGVPRHRRARRRARRAPGRALVGRRDRLLPDLCARQRDLGAALGQGSARSCPTWTPSSSRASSATLPTGCARTCTGMGGSTRRRRCSTGSWAARWIPRRTWVISGRSSARSTACRFRRAQPPDLHGEPLVPPWRRPGSLTGVSRRAARNPRAHGGPFESTCGAFGTRRASSVPGPPR